MTGLSASTLFRAYLKADIEYHNTTYFCDEVSAFKFERQANLFQTKLTAKLEANEKELAELRSELIPRLEEALKDARLALDVAENYIKMGGKDEGDTGHWKAIIEVRENTLERFTKLTLDKSIADSVL